MIDEPVCEVTIMKVGFASRPSETPSCPRRKILHPVHEAVFVDDAFVRPLGHASRAEMVIAPRRERELPGSAGFHGQGVPAG